MSSPNFNFLAVCIITTSIQIIYVDHVLYDKEPCFLRFPIMWTGVSPAIQLYTHSYKSHVHIYYVHLFASSDIHSCYSHCHVRTEMLTFAGLLCESQGC